MRTLIYGAGPIGQWLALRLRQAGQDVTLLARGETHRRLARDGVKMKDGLTGEWDAARVDLVDSLRPRDAYDLALVALPKAGRLAVSPLLARNDRIEHIVFLGNDVAGAASYLDHLSGDRLLLGFPRAGGGWVGDDLVFLDREKPGHERGPIHLGEIDGRVRERTRQIASLLQTGGFGVSIENDIDGWLKYHFAFMAPTAGVIHQCGGEPSAVAGDVDAIHRYCRACREAGSVLRAVGHRKRQPFVFNLYYWTPRRLEGPIFRKFFSSRMAEIGFGLHARGVGPELHQLAAEFAELKAHAGMETPDFDALLACVPEVSTLPEQTGGSR